MILQTKEQVDLAALDIYDIVEKYLKEKQIILPSDAENILYDKLNEYLDNLAGNPDYGNYN